MPPRVERQTTGTTLTYHSPFVGPIDHPRQLRVDVTALTEREVDALGYLKPGVPFTEAGELLGAGDKVHGVTIEAVKVADGNSADDLSAASEEFPVAVALIGAVNRHIIEDNLGDELTADEVDGFDGTPIVLIQPQA